VTSLNACDGTECFRPRLSFTVTELPHRWTTPYGHEEEIARTARRRSGHLRARTMGSVILKLRSDHRKRSEAPLAEVHLHEGETLESALRRFKRQVLQEDIIKEIKRHSFYLKPGERRRVKAALARKRDRKKRRRDSAGEPIHLRDSRV
jgi:small subunit ribosomal protein S21